MDTKTIGINRRNFLKTTSVAGMYLATAGWSSLGTACSSERPVRIGFVGVLSRYSW
jgi:hypothetical protein